MEAVAIELDAISATSGTSTAPFAEVYVTLTKLEHIQLVMEARSWESLHQRAVSRLEQLQDSTKRFVAQLREHAQRREATRGDVSRGARAGTGSGHAARGGASC